MGRLAGLMVAAAMMAGLAGCDARSPVERAMAVLEVQEPNLALLRERDPAAYREIVAVVQNAVDRGQLSDHETLIRQTREVFARVMQQRVLTASDATVQRLALLVAEQTGHLEGNPSVCVGLINGTVGDVQAFIPADMLERERDIFRAMLTEAPMPHPVATQAEIAPKLQRILRDAEAALAMSPAEVEAALSGTASPRDVCRANTYLVRAMGGLPANEGAPLFRSLIRFAIEEEASRPKR